MTISCDVLIIGGGVIGTAIASRLSQTTARVCLVEKAGDVAEGASKGNAGGASSFYDPPGTLSERLTTASYKRWEDICERLNVPFRRMGGLMPALTKQEEELLPPVLEQALACGVRAEILTGKQVLKIEPMISPDCRCALYLPDDAIIDPMRLTFAYAELAARNGVVIRFHSPVIGFEAEEERLIAASTPRETIRARYFINAAGLFADTISQLAGGEAFRMWPRKGQYWLLDREFGTLINHIIYAVTIPDTGTKGIHIYPTTNRSVLLGPSAEDIEDRYDTSTDPETLRRVYESTKRLVPAISLDYAIKSFAALRPACEEPFFVRVDQHVPNLIHAVSRSIGVTTSPGIADYVLELLIESGLEAEENPGALNRLPTVPRLGHEAQPERIDLRSAGHIFSQVVCVCEQVTAGEIEAALTAHVPATTIDGIRKRTGACGGRCQGSVCMVGVAMLYSTHRNCPPEKIPVRDGGEIGVGRFNE